MWDLVQIYMGEASIIDHGLSLIDCLHAAQRELYIADGLATFKCEATLGTSSFFNFTPILDK